MPTAFLEIFSLEVLKHAEPIRKVSSTMLQNMRSLLDRLHRQACLD